MDLFPAGVPFSIAELSDRKAAPREVTRILHQRIKKYCDLQDSCAILSKCLYDEIIGANIRSFRRIYFHEYTGRKT